MIKTFSKVQHFGLRATRSFCKDIIKNQKCEESLKFGTYEIVSPQKVSNQLEVPSSIVKPPYARDYPIEPEILTEPEIKNHNQIETMRESCFLAKEILQHAKTLVQPGVTTDFIDRELHEIIISNAAYPSPLNYKGFPKSVCTSVNNIAAHGIPDDRSLKDGDIINIDITVYLNGYHGDCSQTFEVGNVDDEGKRLIDVTNECLERSISICKPGEPFRSIGRLIEAVAKKNGFNVISCLAGHGIGSYFHGPPDIFHFDYDYPGVMKPGMTFTIEPALTQGSQEAVLLEDGWSIATIDDARTAQAEHTILITEKGCDVLT